MLDRINMKAMPATMMLVPALVAVTLTSTAFGADTTEESHRRPGNRLVRVVTLSQDGLSEKPGQPMLHATLTRLDRAAAFKPDVVCLPEAFTRGDPETVSGPTTNRLSRSTTPRCRMGSPWFRGRRFLPGSRIARGARVDRSASRHRDVSGA